MAEKVINSFPGYECVQTKVNGQNTITNMYRGTDVGKGGYVYAEPGMYGNVALLDVASMHPSSIIAMNYFGEYTKNYKALLDIRLAIKHKNYDAVRSMFGGKLAPYLGNEKDAKALSNALKLPINGAYGLTAATFENPMRDNRNVNNIVALRGALFMRTLQDEVKERGFIVAHIKTDSIKIPDATPEIIQFVMEFGKKYGYTFEHEATYDRMCLVNDAVYIAKYKDKEWCQKTYGYVPDKNNDEAGTWTATGTQFQIPYVFKKLFSREPITFDDMCETKSVTSALYLDMNESLPDVSSQEKELDQLRKKWPDENGEYPMDYEDVVAKLKTEIAEGHNYIFVGKVGQFCPIKPGCNGGLLLREVVDKKTGEKNYASATGAKGYRWLESEMVRQLEKEDGIDRSYYDAMVDAAVNDISEYGDFEWFVSDDPYVKKEDDLPPWESAGPPWDEDNSSALFDRR